MEQQSLHYTLLFRRFLPLAWIVLFFSSSSSRTSAKSTQMPSAKPGNLTLRHAQGEVFTDKTRFRVLVAGRRFGKSYLSCIELLRGAIERPGRCSFTGPDVPDGEGYCVETAETAGSQAVDHRQKRVRFEN